MDDVDESEIECTALVQSATHEANALFTPPCACPRCTATAQVRNHDEPRTMWLPVDGRVVRFVVEDMDLGSTGHTILG